MKGSHNWYTTPRIGGQYQWNQWLKLWKLFSQFVSKHEKKWKQGICFSISGSQPLVLNCCWIQFIKAVFHSFCALVALSITSHCDHPTHPTNAHKLGFCCSKGEAVRWGSEIFIRLTGNGWEAIKKHVPSGWDQVTTSPSLPHSLPQLTLFFCPLRVFLPWSHGGLSAEGPATRVWGTCLVWLYLQ